MQGALRMGDRFVYLKVKIGRSGLSGGLQPLGFGEPPRILGLRAVKKQTSPTPLPLFFAAPKAFVECALTSVLAVVSLAFCRLMVDHPQAMSLTVIDLS